ncbi:MAG: hypothetical protein RSF83_04265 [Hungatella sp.]
MSLILCRQEQVQHPYYMENLRIHIHSSQELCYVIFHHPLLVLDGFVDEHLIEFIRNELDMGFVALKLERWQKTNENQDELLLLILQECDYYSSMELTKYRQKLLNLRKLSAMEYTKKRADYLFHYGQYGKSISEYERLLEELKGRKLDLGFLGRVWNNLGASYARVFQFDKAFAAYEQSYSLLKNLEILKKMYDLTLLQPELLLKERYQTVIPDALKAEWDADFAETKERAAKSAEVLDLDELFKRDPIKRMEGATRMIQNWKKEYRSMG